ncbi:hypothetical protein PUN28_005632 [Cardiocondyla obscurior]|uniref:Uncharacterized protein n=1 Tax=Cardiocondyla obscurior TaxID=286306 RepID=A0AAW2GHI5_9HYME
MANLTDVQDDRQHDEEEEEEEDDHEDAPRHRSIEFTINHRSESLTACKNENHERMH